MPKLTMARAVNAALRQSMDESDKVLLMGEDIGKLGGVFRVTDGLLESFGANRVVDTPLAESGIIGTAVGLAMRGYRPVAEIQFDGFVYPAFDQIVSQVAKLRYRSQGRVKLPITIRLPFGGGIGSPEHHSESPEAYFSQTAGLRVVAASDPQNAYTLLRAAIASDDPVIFLEPKRRYHTQGEVEFAAMTSSTLSRAVVAREGRDLTLVAYGPLVETALESAEVAQEDGVSVEVIDLRSLAPLDLATVQASVEKTGRLLVTHEAAKTLGVGAEIVTAMVERCFYSLQVPPVRVSGYDVPYPPSKYEKYHVPDLDRILEGVDVLMADQSGTSGSGGHA